VKAKKFDCVEMKWEIQKQMQAEFAGVPEAKARDVQMQRVMDDPILGPFYKRLIAAKASRGR
jgi:hypothetical protein